MDFGTTFVYLEAEAPRVSCERHGVVVAAVPWARHNSAFTRAFEAQVCWLTVQASKSAVSQLMRIAWRTVGWICQRVTDEAATVLTCSPGSSGSGSAGSAQCVKERVNDRCIKLARAHQSIASWTTVRAQ